MSYRPGGVDSDEIRTGFVSLQSIHSASELERLIDDLPVLSTSIFHVRLRDELYRQINEYGMPFPDFIQIYDYLFMSLHNRAHRKLVESARPRAASHAQSETVKSFAPPYFLEIAAALGNQLPRTAAPTLNPAVDTLEIRAELQTVIGQSVILPEYEPSIGSRWSMVIVSCASCHHIWLKTCAYSIDLTQAPALVDFMQGERLNNSTCPLCAEALCLPLRVWLQEDPGAGDALTALSCAWKISDSMLVYQPPPGTPQIKQNERILEARFAKLLQRLGWDDDRSSRSEKLEGSHRVFGIAYSIDEVFRYVHRNKEAKGKMPFAMEAMVLEISRKLESGILPLYDAEHFINITVKTQNWPLVNPENPLARSSKPFYHLVQCLAAEASAEIQQLPDAVRTVFAASTCAGFFSIKEVALAEAALARAEDFLKNVPAEDPDHAVAALSIADARSLLFSYLGRHAEADQAREQITKSPLMSGDSLQVRLSRLQLESQAALSLKRQGKLAEALKIYPRCVTTLELMEEEAAASEHDYGGVLVQIWHRLSGDLANWGAILITLAERLEAVHKMQELIAGGSEPDEVARVLKSSHLEPEDLPMTVEAIYVLEEMFSPGITHKMLFEFGRLLLGNALEISEVGEEWEFAGIQAHQLACLLHFHFGDSSAAQEHMRKAIDYASRAGAHSQVSTGHFFFAELARQKDNGTEALNHLLASAREEIRDQVGRGYYAQPRRMRLTLSDAALRAVALGGDARVAVMIAESLKAATTAARLTSGIPIHQEGQNNHPSFEHLDELLARREVLRLRVNRNPYDDADLNEKLSLIESEIESARKAASLRGSRFTRWVDATNLDVSDPQAFLRRLRRLGPRTTLLGIIPIGRTIWTYALWDDGCIIEEQPFPQPGDHSSYDYVTPSEPQETWEQEYLKKLAKAMLEPLDARLKELEPDDRLIISTSDPLAFVPFSALPYRGAPLCERMVVTQTQGIGILEACLERVESQFNSVLCVGSPHRPDWDDLPEAHAEAVTITGRFREVGKHAVLLAEAEATVTNLKAEAGQYDVLHFACHAMTVTAPSESSRLILAPDLITQDSGDFSEDRILSEIILRKGCLVNLAGCHTGVQNSSKGFLLGGLVPSFLIAGAGSVLATLWQIDDDEAARFQIEFYQLLLDGSSPAESLVKTQRACLRGELGAAMRDIRTWAGYVLYGSG